MDVLAVNNFGDTRSGGLAGPMGLFLIVLMCIATVLLIRNMNKRIRRLPDSFPITTERDGVAAAAPIDADDDQSAQAPAADVEANRSPQAVASVDAEKTTVEDSDRGVTGSGGAARD